MIKKIRLFEMFAGYGGASFALKKANIPFECVGYSEIDKFAIKCYEQNHRKPKRYTDDGYNLHRQIFETPKNYGDCRFIDPNELPDFDLLTAGFPCQDVSIAGKKDLSKGRTILFKDIIRIAEVKQPRWMLLENVKGLLSKKFNDFYEYTVKELNRIGYEVFMVYNPKKKRNEIPVLNSKDYGIPQNRERVWYICFREYDDIVNFKLPEKEELKLCLKDILEDEVDERYYLNKEVLSRLELNNNHDFHCYDKKSSKTLDNISNCLKSAAGYENQKINQVRCKRIITVNKNSNETKSGLTIAQSKRIYSPIGISPTLTTGAIIKIYENRVRRLTPKEYFRLMGFLNDEINLDGLSVTRQYKLAGNGWDINLVSKIFKKLFGDINE